VPGVLVVLTLPILADSRRYGEPSRLLAASKARQIVAPIVSTGAHPEPEEI
jgi:hypothetical protein